MNPGKTPTTAGGRLAPSMRRILIVDLSLDERLARDDDLARLEPLDVHAQAHAQLLETETARVLPKGSSEVGAAFEPQTSSAGTEKAVPLMVTWGITKRFELMVEPVAYTSIHSKTAASGTGPGDIDVTATYLFKQEGAGPALGVAGELKIPTARNVAIGTGQPDAALYLTGSKGFGRRFDTHAHVSYTVVGQPAGVQLGNIVGYGVAGVFRAASRLDVFGELLGHSASTPGGEGTGTAPIVPEAAGGELVATGGIAVRVRPGFVLYVSRVAITPVHCCFVLALSLRGTDVDGAGRNAVASPDIRPSADRHRINSEVQDVPSAPS